MTRWVRPAGNTDLETMIELRTEAERWLRAQGIQQWTNDYFDYARAVMATAVDAGIAWVVEDERHVVATVSVSPRADMDFWTVEDHPDIALYLGKMIVRRSAAGQGLGNVIMNWASRKAEEAGKHWLRIDVHRDNTKLHRYYLDRGFRHVRTVHPRHRRTESGWLAQRPAGFMTSDDLLITKTKRDVGRTEHKPEVPARPSHSA